ncbi:hypothetical protein [Aureispira anguillae]|uniref:Uncharacterized protein n=1 Tax=Aureispira anguillae TaxID=2864201 RepID=A0A916DR55_9BACT|nr:hypothetical protein [Aureispira anguillae]BDS10016.1 hypothetical protein AsAng_0007210 [Aureispira anguillae]
MDKSITHLVINWINIEDNVILVGATDNQRWESDIEIGMSGVDSKTIVYVTLTDHGKGISISEKAEFHCSPGDPTRTLAMSHLIKLYEIAWMIKNKNLDLQTALNSFWGKKIA